MKKIKSNALRNCVPKFLIFIMLLVSLNCFAGWDASRSKGCPFWNKRFYARVHAAKVQFMGANVFMPHKWERKTDYGCEWARVSVKMDCAWAWASADWANVHGASKDCQNMTGVFWFAGLPFNENSFLSGSKIFGKYDIANYYTNGNEILQNEHDVTISPIFNEDSPSDNLPLNNISITLKSHRLSKMDNKVNICIWRPLHDESNLIPDTLVTMEKTLKYFNIKINGGEVTFEGNLFDSSEFSIEEIEDTIIVKYIGGNKTIALPQGINSDQVTFRMSGDILPPEVNNFYDLLDSLESISLIVFPNPFFNQLSLKVNEHYNSCSIKLYDLNGTLIKSINSLENTSNSSDESLFIINLSDVLPGKYYVVVSTLNRDYFRIINKY